MRFLLIDKRWAIMWLMLALFILGMCQSCSTLEKRIGKAKVLAYEHPNEFASFCADKFPVKENVIKGKDSIRTDTVVEEKIVRVPVVVKGDTVYVEAKCPKSNTVTRTVTRTDTVVKENTAKTIAMQLEMSKMNNELVKERTLREGAEKGSKSKNWWMVGLGLLLLASVYFNVRKIF